MAIYHNGIKINSLYYNVVKVQSVYHNGIKIYSSGLPIGTILWSGHKAFDTDTSDDTSYFLINKEITLSNAINKCKNGIVVNFSKAVSFDYRNYESLYFDKGFSGNIQVPKNFSNESIYNYNDYGSTTTVSLIKSDDSTVYFNSSQGGKNSTYIGHNSNYDATFLYIDSITAY